jgi:hypothetical protein
MTSCRKLYIRNRTQTSSNDYIMARRSWKMSIPRWRARLPLRLAKDNKWTCFVKHHYRYSRIIRGVHTHLLVSFWTLRSDTYSTSTKSHLYTYLCKYRLVLRLPDYLFPDYSRFNLLNAEHMRALLSVSRYEKLVGLNWVTEEQIYILIIVSTGNWWDFSSCLTCYDKEWIMEHRIVEIHGRLLGQECAHHRMVPTTMPRGDANWGVLYSDRPRQSGHWRQNFDNRHGGKYVLYLITHNTIKTYVRAEEELHRFLTSVLDKVNGQVHIQVTVPPGKEHTNPSEYRWGRP